MADASSFGARLALIRQRMGWGNVKTAAEQCGLPPESWRTWERDGVEPRRLTTIAMTIATRTGCDYLWLVHGPARGAMRGTGEYLAARVVASIPTVRPMSVQPIAGSADRDARHTRSVRQTRPVALLAG